MTAQSGVKACEAALQRLLDGCPQVAGHVGIQLSEITPATVSVEAGYDKGYLKRARAPHKALIARIDNLKLNANKSSNDDKKQLRKALRKSEAYREEAEEAKAIMNKVLTQNLILINKVRELELQLGKLTGNSGIEGKQRKFS